MHLTRTDFHAAIRRNRRNTAFLCATLTVIGMIAGGGIGWAFGVMADPEGDGALAAAWALLAAAFMLVFSLGWTGVALLFGDRIVLGLTGARAASKTDAPVLHNVVEEMALAAGLPVPRVMIVETEALNAFATGMRPEKAAVAVTRGLLNALSRDELQGVVAHEMGHVANNDVLYMTAVGVLVGLIVVVSDLALRSTRFMAWGGGGRRSGGRKGGGGLVIVAIVVLLLIGLLSPVMAKFVQMAVSRQREFLADATSVKLTRNPLGLIGALRKLDAAPVRWDDASRAVQHMFIVNPFKKFGENASALMATHPSLEQRIQRLQALG
ncbi:MAG: M48 family metallopeptidase [Rhodospirillales bacterium]